MPNRFKITTAALLFSTLTSMAQTQYLDIQGHRGCRGLMPENTIPAFLKALDLGVTTLELDVCISADGQVVVSHEPYFNAAFTTKPDGIPVAKSEEKALNLYRMPYSEIKKYDTGQRGNVGFPDQQKLPTYKPLLREVIEAAEAHAQKTDRAKPRYNIEVKSEEKEYNVSQPPVADFCDLVYAAIHAQLPPERVTVQSFDFNVLKHWKQKTDAGQYKKLALAALVSRQGPDKAVKDLNFRPDIFSPYHVLLSKAKVDSAHKLGMKVIPWTVNDTENMQKLIDWGVDGIITDYPDRAKTLR